MVFMTVFTLEKWGILAVSRSIDNQASSSIKSNQVPRFWHDLHPILCVPSRFAGRYRDSRKESFTSTDLNLEIEGDSSSRRHSFMKMVGLGKLKREFTADRSSLGTEEQEVHQKVEEAKPREPLSGNDDKWKFSYSTACLALICKACVIHWQENPMQIQSGVKDGFKDCRSSGVIVPVWL